MNLADRILPDSDYEVEFYWPHKMGVFSRSMLLPAAAILILLFGIGPLLFTWFTVQRGRAIDYEVVMALLMCLSMTFAVIYITYVHFTVRHAFHERCWLGNQGVRVRHASGLETTLGWSECTSARSSLLGQCVMIYSPRLQAPAVVFREMWTADRPLPVRLMQKATSALDVARNIVADNMGDRLSRTL